MREFLEILLRKQGHRVATAADAEPAPLARARRGRASTSSSPTCASARDSGLDVLREVKAALAGDRGGGGDRLRHHRERHPGHEARAPTTTCSSPSRWTSCGSSSRRRSSTAPSSPENRVLRHRVGRAAPRAPAEIIGAQPRDRRRSAQLVEKVAPTRTTVLVTGRERRRQGGRRPRDPRPGRPARPALRRHQLRRHPRGAHRERALRPREGQLHRRDRHEAGPLRGGRQRDALPRRDRRAAAATSR